ncbi:MAG: adenosylcobalamin-dependent ribonucleoside-diphosphate reductase [Thermincola sp.]|nr:adenosylcobalamin-dependent ribonucleoside-diphosphate reductase [Thermincola sp.]MDT3702741.1 adenosylcobalamin-dependent ribonucleoside-diphosphate reductase [Thermincola sp.]
MSEAKGMDIFMTGFSEDAISILEKRYLLKNAAGEVIEVPEQLLMRVARTVAAVEKDQAFWEESFYSIMLAKRFFPNSPTLANAGRKNGQLAACFVLPVPDSIEGIFGTMKRAALVHKTGGGTGFSFSDIRPSGDPVSSTGGVASGPLPFIKAFNCATDAVKQGGMRRGANMAVMKYSHPDIFEFIAAKQEEGILANFNLSVGVSNEFMNKSAHGGSVTLVNPRTGNPSRQVKACDLFEAMVMAAWDNGEPGILFMDRINEANTVPGLGRLEATNPCGEQPLFGYECCNLGSLNLPQYLRINGGNYEIDWDLLERDILTAVRFLDNVIDVNYYPFPETEALAQGNRKIGLGIMGFADFLIRLGIPYASDAAIETANTLMGFINRKAREASTRLSEEKGSFFNMKKSVFKGSMRNATVTTIAPTGTLSLLAGTSSGIEPLLGLNFIKEALEGNKFAVTYPYFAEVGERRGFLTPGLMEEVNEKGSLRDITGVPEDVRSVFATAFEIPAEWHIKVQAAFQRHVDNAVSKTINFPNGATVEDVRQAFFTAWKLGCKGLTIFREGSRENQVMRFAGKDKEPDNFGERCAVCAD